MIKTCSKLLAVLMLLAFYSPLLCASDNLVDDYNAAFQTQDRDAKKDILIALSKSELSDDVVLPLLVKAVADRQAHDIAVQELRNRTGLQPSPHRGVGGYPAYPLDDSPEQWNAWLEARENAKHK